MVESNAAMAKLGDTSYMALRGLEPSMRRVYGMDDDGRREAR